MVYAICKEALLQRSYINEAIDTIYFGGGTPSLLSSENLKEILDKIHELFSINANAEITLEANPDDINALKLQEWKGTGINRLSIGVQSFFEEDLQWMNRAHTATQAITQLQLALQYFKNITIDLIYGTPGLTHEKWKANVEQAISLGIPHLSCYALTVEPKTPLDKLIRNHEKTDVNPDQQSEQFLLLMEWLEAAGYEHYEISNFAIPGSRSRHNSSYWQQQPYLGIGPAAHSYNGRERQWNIANNNTYISQIAGGLIPFEKEILTDVQRLNENTMTSLRTMEGLDMGIFDEKQAALIKAVAKKYIDGGHMIRNGSRLLLTRTGKLLADGIAADLFI